MTITRERIFADDTLDLVSELINMGNYDEAESLINWEYESRDDAIKGMEIIGYKYMGVCKGYDSPKMREMLSFDDGKYQMFFDSWIDTIEFLAGLTTEDDITENQFAALHELESIKRH